MARWFGLSRIKVTIGRVFKRAAEQPSRPSEPQFFSPRPKNYWGDALEDIYRQVDAKRWDYSDEISDYQEEQGRELFYKGWVSKRIGSDEREEARQSFRDWMTQWDVPNEFPWDDWREWYEENAA